MGGLIADRQSIQTDLWIGAGGLLAAVGVFSLADNTQPAGVTRRDPRLVARNRQFVRLAVYFSIAFRSVVIRFRPRLSFAILLVASLLGTLSLWQTSGAAWYGAAFLLLGAISTTWVVMQASIGRSVPEHVRGLALGVTESLYYAGIAVASYLAGRLYVRTPAHELPLIYGSVAILIVLICWTAVPLGGHAPLLSRRLRPAPLRSTKRE